MKAIIKKMIYVSGLLGLLHRFRNGSKLTVVLFHRVLPDDSPLWESADREWSVRSSFFHDAIRFFKARYNVIGMEELREFRNGKALPPRPLLVTFDDGWTDTLEVAFPLLEQENLPSVLFATTDAIGKPILSWQEALQILHRYEKIERRDLEAMEKEILVSSLADSYDKDGLAGLVKKLNAMVRDRREAVYKAVENLYVAKGMPVLMATQKQVRDCSIPGQEIGGHGRVHESHIQLDNGREELALSSEELKALRPGHKTDMMSFPHSKYSKALVQVANKAGFAFVFGGSNCLNELKDIGEARAVIKRINIEEDELLESNGKFSAEKASWYLFRAPVDAVE